MTPNFYINLDGVKALCALQEARRVSLSGFAVGIALCRCMDRDGVCWPSRQALGARAGTPRIDTVRKAIKELVAVGFIMSEKGQRSNRYQLCAAASAGTESASAEIPSCRRGKCADRTVSPASAESAPADVFQNPADALCVGSADAESASALYNMNESKNEYSEVAAAHPNFTSPRKPKMEAKTEPKKTSSPKPKSPPKPKVTLTDSGFVIPGAIRQTWAIAFSGVDIDREAARAFAWCQNNPRKAPKKDFGRFLHGWMNRAEPTRDPEMMLAPDAPHSLSQSDIDQMLLCERQIAAATKRAANG